LVPPNLLNRLFLFPLSFSVLASSAAKLGISDAGGGGASDGGGGASVEGGGVSFAEAGAPLGGGGAAFVGTLLGGGRAACLVGGTAIGNEVTPVELVAAGTGGLVESVVGCSGKYGNRKVHTTATKLIIGTQCSLRVFNWICQLLFWLYKPVHYNFTV